MSEVARKRTNTTLHGLNAAAIIFLYSTFVPKHDYEILAKRCLDTEKELAAAKATVSVLANMASAKFQ
jgi:hypothetical protein